ncbi:PREDICTED: 39S ribosomal protein L9, mitochondrial [Nanorana parkeri]|uniref:39S ribosomal protein L9, mitochondrial n=1 Tax=Nanorana parkeri TaxID=125878 RepID=UPI000854A611|nr:PREDICTED: 39S ribosomal protein L9, mitochondrial [Nanorana parkeri]
MLKVTSRLLSLRAPICVTPSRGTVIVERWYNVPLAKEGEEPYLHPRRHRIYRVVEDTKHSKKGKMALILTQSIHKLGSRGDTVLVEKAFGRNKLLPQGLAVYPSPENKQMFKEEKEKQETAAPADRQQTWTGEMTVQFLRNSRLEVRMRPESGWTLSREMVARHFFRNLGVVVPAQALNIPEEPITTFGEFWCVNGIDTVRVPMDVVQFDGPRSKRYLIWLAKQAAVENSATGGSKAPESTEPPPEGSNAPQPTSTEPPPEGSNAPQSTSTEPPPEGSNAPRSTEPPPEGSNAPQSTSS